MTVYRRVASIEAASGAICFFICFRIKGARMKGPMRSFCGICIIFLSALFFIAESVSAQATKVFIMAASQALSGAATTRYPERLQILLGSKYTVINGGYNSTCLLLKGDLPWMPHMPQLFAARPDIVIIELGSNDSKANNWVYGSQYGHDFKVYVDTVRTMKNGVRVIMCYTVPSWGDNTDDTIRRAQIRMIDQYAPGLNVPIIDLFNPMQNMASHFPDRIHGDDVAQDTIARLLYRGLMRITAIRGPDDRMRMNSPGNHPGIVSYVKNRELHYFLPKSMEHVIHYFDFRGKVMMTHKNAGNHAGEYTLRLPAAIFSGGACVQRITTSEGTQTGTMVISR
jgi:acyl-CoA thioesterase I